MNILESARNSTNNTSLVEFTNGIDTDRRLATAEIAVQRAWIAELQASAYLSTDECNTLDKALTKASELMDSNQFRWDIEDEDIHMNIERFLIEQCGDLGKKIHLGRSRNDLIATTLRIFVRHQAEDIQQRIRSFSLALANQGQESLDVFIPGLTHLQHGQPVRLAHLFHSWGLMIGQGASKFSYSSRSAMVYMPLGSAAFAGTTLELDLHRLAASLGFSNPASNSMLAVGDRDFLLDTLHAAAVIATHLRKIAHDMIFYSSTYVGLFQLPPAWSTGSSIMPNKRNPDVPELIRAKAARIIGCDQEAKHIYSGFGTSYSSDLHEIKRTLLLATDELRNSLDIFTAFVQELRWESKNSGDNLNQGHILATDVANHLANSGYSFRDAYGQVAQWVEQSESRGQQVHHRASQALGAKFGFAESTEMRKLPGGTARTQVAKGLAHLVDWCNKGADRE